jgi:hypothetical protein
MDRYKIKKASKEILQFLRGFHLVLAGKPLVIISNCFPIAVHVYMQNLLF